MDFERNEIREWFSVSAFSSKLQDCAGENYCTISEKGNELAGINEFTAMEIKQ